MSLHLLKLFVGLDTLPELAAWQTETLKRRKQEKVPVELYHVTRHTPKRAGEILPNGSIYWVMKGWIVARQRLLEFRPVERNEKDYCALVFDEELVTVEPRAHRPFQGWRYLEGDDAPKDIGRFRGENDLPDKMRRELAALGLL